VVVESDGAPMTANIGDGDPLGVYLEERIIVTRAGFCKAGKDPLEDFYWEVVDGVRGNGQR
jgi:hypothetical protein